MLLLWLTVAFLRQSEIALYPRIKLLMMSPLTLLLHYRALRDFTLSHAWRIYSSMGNPLTVRGLTNNGPFFTQTFLILHFLNFNNSTTSLIYDCLSSCDPRSRNISILKVMILTSVMRIFSKRGDAILQGIDLVFFFLFHNLIIIRNIEKERKSRTQWHQH